MKQESIKYDRLLKGGHVIDPANSIDGPLDVAVKGDRIACVAKDIPIEESLFTADVSSLYVTPGLIDLHLHVSPRHRTSVRADVVPARTGVTTAVDAGSLGVEHFEEFKTNTIDTAKVRILAFLNIARCGMERPWEQDPAEWDPLAVAGMIQRYPDILVGVKAAHYMGVGFGPYDAAVHAGRLTRRPVMADYWPRTTATYEDLLLKHLRPGDIHTHYHGRHFPLLDENGEVSDFLWEAKRRGIIFDVGHGTGSFWFRHAVPAVRQGFLPDSISTDLHQGSVLLPNATMPNVMSKFLNMGMTLQDVVRRSTTDPARIIKRLDLGTLSVGASADLAVFDLQKGQFTFVDDGHARMHASQNLECVMTICRGQLLWNPRGLGWPDWESAGHYYFTDALLNPEESQWLDRPDWPA